MVPCGEGSKSRAQQHVTMWFNLSGRSAKVAIWVCIKIGRPSQATTPWKKNDIDPSAQRGPGCLPMKMHTIAHPYKLEWVSYGFLQFGELQNHLLAPSSGCMSRLQHRPARGAGLRQRPGSPKQSAYKRTFQWLGDRSDPEMLQRVGQQC